jgi:hypothetical protein
MGMPPGNRRDSYRETAKMGMPPGNRRDSYLEAYLNGTSQGSRSEDAREDGHICGRSRSFVNNAG